MQTITPTTDPSLDSGGFPPEVKIPTAQELYEFFNSFFSKWTGLSSQRVDWDVDEIAPLPRERSLLFSQPTTGVLVIRTTEDFEVLLEKSTLNQKSKEGRKELFVEIVILFWHLFVSKFWQLDSRKLPPVLFKKTIPLDWPKRPPTVACMVFIEKQPLEIRLWSPLSEAERNSWQPSHP